MIQPFARCQPFARDRKSSTPGHISQDAQTNSYIDAQGCLARAVERILEGMSVKSVGIKAQSTID